MNREGDNKIELYTTGRLSEDIQKNQEERSKVAPDQCAQDRYKLKVFDFMCNFGVAQNKEGSNYPGINRDKIEQLVEDDKYLFSYTFFLSSIPAYNYTWTYQRQSIDRFIEFIYQACRFIHYVVADIRVIQSNYSINGKISIEFHDLFEVKFGENPAITTIMNWENFHRIADVKRGYYVSIKCEDTRARTKYMTYDDEHENEIKKLINRAKCILDENQDCKGMIEERKLPKENE